MVYLDYCATTPVDKDVLKTFNDISNDFIGNPNSLHKLGVEAKSIINASTNQIAELLNINSTDIIYTSGASESNNMAIKGVALKYQNRGKHIITTEFEHSSVYGCLTYLQKQGFKIDFVKTNEKGIVDLNHLKELITDETILVTICAVNSEIGIVQPIEEIANIIKDYPKIFFHTDMTQALGKTKINLNNVDMASFSAHKIYGIKGIGFLYKKDSIVIEPLIHGGKSTTIYRSGTPSTALIASISKAVRLIITNYNVRYNYVTKLKEKLIDGLKDYENLYINSNEYCVPHVINISVTFIKPETLLHALEKYDIYISTQTACSNANISKSVMSLTNDEARASSSVRISLSHMTKEEDIDYLLKIFDVCYKELKF